MIRKNLELFKFFFNKKNKIWDFTYKSAEYGNLECLKYAIDNGCTFNKNVFIIALKNKHSECIRYLYELNPDYLNDSDIIDSILDYIMINNDFILFKDYINNSNIVSKAIKHNNSDYLQHAIKNGYIINRDDIIIVFEYDNRISIISHILDYIICNNKFDLFKFFIEKNKTGIMSEEEFEKCEKKYCEETKTWEVHCGIGHDVLLREHTVNPPPVENNVAYDRTRLQEWLKINKKNPITNTSIDDIWFKHTYPKGLNTNSWRDKNEFQVIMLAIKYGNLEYLKYAIENKYEITESNIIHAVQCKHSKCIKYLFEVNSILIQDSYNRESILDYIMTNNDFELFKLLINKSLNWKQFTYIAIKYGNLEYLKYAIENKCIITESDIVHAIQYKQPKCIKYLFEADPSIVSCRNQYLMCDYIMTNNDFELFKFLIKKNLKWEFTDKAAKYGNLEYLKYSIENKCEITDNTLKEAGNNGKLDCVIYLHELGCNLYKKRDLHLNCIEYFNKHGYKWTNDDEAEHKRVQEEEEYQRLHQYDDVDIGECAIS